MDFETLDKKLNELIDKDLLCDLDKYLDEVKKSSRALASSLKRCFDNARNSKRFLLAYELGRDSCREQSRKEQSSTEQSRLFSTTGEDDNLIKKYLEERLKEHFEKNDFMHYREFVRLLRACTIDVGGNVSSHIKEMYNEFFFGKRLIAAYKLGAESLKGG